MLFDALNKGIHMTNTTSLIPPVVLSALVLTARTTPPGPWVEVGVYNGGSALELYRARGDQPLHLFDTFEGIPFSEPDKGDRHGVGEFDGRANLPALQQAMPDAMFHVGVFPDTLPDDLRGIAFAHIDCDQYRSVSDCIAYLRFRMVIGGVMWFDDYSALEGARRAVLEYFDADMLHHAPEGRRFVIV